MCKARYKVIVRHRVLFDRWLDIWYTTWLVIKYLVICAITVDLPLCWTKLLEFSKDISCSTKLMMFSSCNILVLVKDFETVVRNLFKYEFSCIYMYLNLHLTLKSRVCNAFIYFPYYQSKNNCWFAFYHHWLCLSYSLFVRVP